MGHVGTTFLYQIFDAFFTSLKQVQTESVAKFLENEQNEFKHGEMCKMELRVAHSYKFIAKHTMKLAQIFNKK